MIYAQLFLTNVCYGIDSYIKFKINFQHSKSKNAREKEINEEAHISDIVWEIWLFRENKGKILLLTIF